MRIKNLLNSDDRAVSPVIGVILMVAITVILAAVIGTFVLGLGENVQSTSPSASFGFDFNSGTLAGSPDVDLTGSGSTSTDGTLTITHESGDAITAPQVTVADQAGSGSSSWASSGEITAGDTFVANIDSDDVVRVTWTSEGGDNSATLGSFSGPDA